LATALVIHLNQTMMSKKNKVLFLGAAYGTGNMGVDALLSGSIASVLHAASKTEIVLLDFSHEARTHQVPGPQGVVEARLENLRFSWKLWLRNNGFRLLVLALLMRALPIPAFRRRVLANHPALEVIGDSTVALSLAGGDSFSDIYGFRRLLYVCLPQFLVKAMGRPLVLLPQTLGPFKAGWAKWMGRRVMNSAIKVYSRDLASLELGREMLGENANHLAYSPDMAFALEPRAPEGGMPEWLSRQSRPLVVGLNVSGLLFMGGYSGDNMFGLKGDYPQLMRSLIRWFVQVAGADLVLVTHVTGWEGDEKACARLHEELAAECGGRLHLADPSYDHREIKYLIGKCDFFLGARMHACIAALSQGVPAVGLAYSRKFAGVFESVGVPELVADLTELGNEEALGRIRDVFLRRDNFREELVRAAAAARAAALGLYGELGAAASCGSFGKESVTPVCEPDGEFT
jgi:polysaccharide pyruvyl transferase WcaK-like protein